MLRKRSMPGKGPNVVHVRRNRGLPLEAKTSVRSDGVLEISQYERAEDMVAALRPGSGIWKPLQESWLFRGQVSATWRLIPSAFRSDLAHYSHPDAVALYRV